MVPEDRTHFRQARSDSLEELRRRLPGADAAYLEGATENPSLTAREMLLILRQRQTPPTLLGELSRNRRWTRFHEIKRALALHPATPRVAVRSLMAHLFWKDLLELTVAPHADPVARRQAEKRLRDRVPELTLGERIALARRATRPVIEALRDQPEPPVLEALVGNPRTVEADAVRLARSGATPVATLDLLSRHTRWSARRSVRLELLRNPRTPVPVSLKLLRGLHVQDLRVVAVDPATPRIVRVAAERSLRRPGERSPTRNSSASDA